LRIVVHLLAIALIGTWMSFACLAEDATGAGPSSAPSANPDGSRPPAREDAAGGGKDSDAIDTHITVHSGRAGRRDAAKEGDRKVSSFARPIFRPRRSAHESAGRVTRDAIGQPVGRYGGTEQGSGQRHDLPAFVSNPAAAPGFGANTGGGLARTSGAPGRPPSNANPVVRPAALNRGTINGTNLVRPGFGPSSIGGPAKPVAGINGTTIRPKH